MRIAIMGSGGLGGYYGAMAARAGHDVTFIARGSHLHAIQDNGLLLRTPNAEILIKPAKATANPAEVGPVDLVLFCVKAYDAETAARQILPMMGADTVVIPVLNGVDHIETLTRAIGGMHVLGGFAIMSAHRQAPGIIAVHTAGTHLRFGDLGDGSEERCKTIEVRLGLDGVQAVPNITQAMWRKFAGICGAGLCSVVRGNYGVVLGCAETRAMLARCMDEVVAVAHARHIALSADLAADVIGTWEHIRDVKPSMLIDLERSDRLEVEWLNGAASRMGTALGVPTPVNDFIYACLKPWAKDGP